ncbi:hypothetical protein [Sulfurimonas sp. HSL-1716]|uniref:hypothetical protein n=1 Tax=Hydrocurvibacter sulfurireducens TaxID=3131937 RepID=UPI0031F7A54B
MTTIIMLFILPLGILVYFFDKKVQKNNKANFQHYISQVKATDITLKEKLDKIDEMYYQNGYKRILRTDDTLVVEKKHFNLGVLLIFFGALAYFGLPLYYLYYRFILKPARIEISLQDSSV